MENLFSLLTIIPTLSPLFYENTVNFEFLGQRYNIIKSSGKKLLKFKICLYNIKYMASRQMEVSIVMK